MKVVVALLVFTVFIGLFLEAVTDDTQSNQDQDHHDGGVLPTKVANSTPKPTPPPGQECKDGYVFIKTKCKKRAY